MQKNESPLPPPVPPRRKRCKVASKQSCTIHSHSIKTQRKHRQAPPLPPPAAPQRSKVGKRTSSLHFQKNCSPTSQNSLNSLEFTSDTEIITNNPVDRDRCNKIDQNEEVGISEKLQNDTRKLEREYLETNSASTSRSNSPFSKPPEPNKYPPLYFTFQDYEKVMEESKNHNITAVQKGTENIRKKSETMTNASTETVSFNNEREEIYFRVTTTDRPFEKCLGEWNKSYDEDGDELTDDPSNLYIFEDYIDRSNKINARPTLLFSEDFFSMQYDDNSAITEKSTTRVRFLIESPSTSTPDLDLDDDGTGYGKFLEKQFEEQKPTVQITEITDDELQTFYENISTTNEIDSEQNMSSNFESETNEDENLSESFYVPTTNQINDTYSDLEEDIEVLTTADSSEDKYVYTGVKHNDELSRIKEFTDETMILKCETSVKTDLDHDSIAMNKGIENIYEIRKIYVDPSHYELVNEDMGTLQHGLATEHIKPPKNSQLDAVEHIKCRISSNDVTEHKEQTGTFENIITDTAKVNIQATCEKVSMNVAQLTEEKAVPVNVRRNSFLETMLSEDNISQDSWNSGAVNCEVIAAHPKQDQSTPLDQQQITKLPDVVVVTTKPDMAPSNSPKIKLADVGPRPRAQGKINVSSCNNKSAGEVKNDVLNELLTNFSAIKLKSVNTSTREVTQRNNSNEPDMTKSMEVKTDKTHEIKRQEDVVKNENNTIRIPNSNKAVPATDNTNNTIIPVNNTCAIVKEEAPELKQNDNDNKAMTPVVVSKDQLREVVSIAPGSVRNFVKYYEIHAEISNIDKIKDNAYKKRKCDLARDRTNIAKKSTNFSEKSKKTNKNSTPLTKMTAKREDKVTDEFNKVSVIYVSSPSISSKSHTQKQSCIRNVVSSPKLERKKSVQFDKGCTIINPHKKMEKEKEVEEGTFSSFIGGIRTRLKRKAPAKPDVKRVEKLTGLKLDEQRTESSAIICIQKPPEAKAVACTAKPGNRSFLPKNETLQSNQTIVFYCTV